MSDSSSLGMPLAVCVESALTSQSTLSPFFFSRSISSEYDLFSQVSMIANNSYLSIENAMRLVKADLNNYSISSKFITSCLIFRV